eukprot:3468182-Amphidinium_carterae.2
MAAEESNQQLACKLACWRASLKFVLRETHAQIKALCVAVWLRPKTRTSMASTSSDSLSLASLSEFGEDVESMEGIDTSSNASSSSVSDDAGIEAQR